MRIIAGIITDKVFKAYVTKKQQKRYYVGSPSNIMSILEAQGCNEISIFNIDSCIGNNYINQLRASVESCFLPLSYGGGIKTINAAKKLVSSGVERLIFGSALFNNKTIIKQCVELFGAQSVCISLDLIYDKTSSKVLNRYANKFVKLDETIDMVNKTGCSEIIVTFSDHNCLESSTLPINILSKLRDLFSNQIIIAGGISSHLQIERYSKLGINGVLLSSRIYLHRSYDGVCIDYNRLTL